MRHLTLSLCGPVQVRLDDGALPASQLGAKPLALLAYLAIERGAAARDGAGPDGPARDGGHREHTRDELTTLLWGEFPEAQARASLRQALAQLRRALGDIVVVERNVVRVDACVTLDVAPLLDGWNGDARAGLALEPAQFLAGLRVQRDGGFEEWAEAMRAVLRRRHAALLAEAARDAAARLDWGVAMRLADRWREADPLSADAVHAAMEARHLAGRDSEALAIYAAHRAALAAETGEVPAAALKQLATRIARASGIAGVAGAPTPLLGVPAFGVVGLHAPLVGRAREWALLGTAWAAARRGTGGVVMFAGEPGAGRTRLLADFARRAGADGGSVLRARSREPAASVPFATAAELLRSALDAPGFAAADGQWLAEVARLVPEVRARLPGVPAAPPAALADEWRLFEGAAQLVATLAAERPLLVLLDDVQWCDAASAGVVRVLVERTAALPVLWAVALATGLAERDAAGVRLASALGAAPDASVTTLLPLAEEDVHALLVAVGAAPGDARVRALAAQLHATTGGVARHVLELLHAARTRGMLVDGGSGWRPTEALAGAAGLLAMLDAPALAAPVRDRLMRLGEDGRAVLLTVTLAGDGCTPALLSHVHGVSRLRAAAIGDGLVERGLAREAGGAYRVASGLVAAVVRDWGSGARRGEVERALAAARADERTAASDAGPGVRAGPLPDGMAPRATGEWRSSV